MPRGIAYPGLSYKDADWYKRRARQLRRFPWCLYCQKNGRRTKATHVDHIIPHRGNHQLFYDDGNLQSLCRICSNVVKQIEEIAGGEIGCDLLGNPRSQEHPWNGGDPSPSKMTAQKIGRLLRERKKELES